MYVYSWRHLGRSCPVTRGWGVWWCLRRKVYIFFSFNETQTLITITRPIDLSPAQIAHCYTLIDAVVRSISSSVTVVARRQCCPSRVSLCSPRDKVHNNFSSLFILVLRLRCVIYILLFYENRVHNRVWFDGHMTNFVKSWDDN